MIHGGITMHEKHKGMIDNRMVKDDHQEGIDRVLQRGHEKREGHFGKMGLDHKHGHGDSFKRHTGNKTPATA